MVKVDHHAAVLNLRGKYALARKLVNSEKLGEAAMKALDAIQDCLERLSPKTLSVPSVQGLIDATLTLLGDGKARQLYAESVLVFFYSVGAELVEPLKDGLYSVA